MSAEIAQRLHISSGCSQEGATSSCTADIQTIGMWVAVGPSHVGLSRDIYLTFSHLIMFIFVGLSGDAFESAKVVGQILSARVFAIREMRSGR